MCHHTVYGDTIILTKLNKNTDNHDTPYRIQTQLTYKGFKKEILVICLKKELNDIVLVYIQ